MEFCPLSPLQIEILGCVMQGLTDEMIASRLNLRLPVVRGELATIFKKVGVLNRLELLLCICSGQVNFGKVNRMAA